MIGNWLLSLKSVEKLENSMKNVKFVSTKEKILISGPINIKSIF